MITRNRLLLLGALMSVLGGCGGGGGGSSGNPAPQDFVGSVQGMASASSEDAEPLELTLDSGGDQDADAEPLTL